MPLEKRVIDIPLTGGVEGNTESPLKARLDILENGVYRKRRGVSKRFGTALRGLSSATPFGGPGDPQTTPETLATYREECLRFGRGLLTTFSTAINNRVYVDKCSECVAEYSGVAASPASLVYPDVAVSGGLAFYAYTDESASNGYGRVLSTVVDTATGAALFTSLVIESGTIYTHVRVVVAGTTAVLIYSDNANKIYARTMSVTSPGTWSSRTTLVSDAVLVANAVYDVCVTGSNFVLGYVGLNTGVSTYFAKIYSAALASVASGFSLLTGINTPACVGVTADTTRIWFGYSHYTGATRVVGYTVFNATTAAELITATTIASSASRQARSIGLEIIAATPTQCGLIVGLDDRTIYTARVSTTPAVIEGPRPTNGSYVLKSRPWTQDGKIFAAVQNTLSAGGSVVVVDTGIDNTSVSNYVLRPVATLVPRQTFLVGSLSSADMLPVSSVASLGSSQWLFAFDTTLTHIAGTGTIYSATASFNVPRQLAEGNQVAMVSGGVPSIYDGVAVAEAGYLEVPSAVGTALSASAGSLSAGAYTYRLVREWTDAKGNIHRGAPSPESVSLTVAVSKAIDVTFTQLGVTTKQDAERDTPITNTLYRTKAGGTVLYRLTSLPPTSTFQNGTFSSPQVTFTDSVSDASLVGRPILYTTGGTETAPLPDAILDNVCPPSARYVLAHKNRFWLAGTDEDTIWYSKTLTAGEGPGFNEALTIPAFDGGRVTAIATLDSALVIFKAGSVWIVEGDGHDDLGTGSTLTEPRRISSDTGCIDFRSVVIVPDGLMFQSARGIYLLGRGLDVSFAGEDVADKTLGKTITSAVLVGPQNQVRFTVHDASAPTAAVTLVWDYLVKAWSTFVYTATDVAARRGAVSATRSDGLYWWVTPEGQEYTENEATYLDGGTTWVTLTLRTAWLPLAGAVQGYQRIWRAGVLADRKSAHGVVLSAQTDFVESATQTATFTEATVTALTVEELELRPTTQRCEAFRFQFNDTAPAVLGTGQGATLNGITLEYGVLPGKSRRLAASQKG